MSWRSACWGLALVTIAACNQKSADSEPGGEPISSGYAGSAGNGATGGGTPFPCAVGAALQRNCWQCHGPTLNNAAPMHLTTWEAVHQMTRDGAEQIFQRIGERINDSRNPMPPEAICAPSGGCKPTPDEIQTLMTWIGQGAPAGDGCAPPPPPPGGGGVPNGAGGAPSGGQGGVVYYGTGGVVGGGAGPTGTGGSYEPPPIQTPDGGIVNQPPPGDEPVPPDPSECNMLNFHARADVSGAPFQVPTGEQYYCFSFHVQLSAGAQGLAFYKDIDNSTVIHHWLLYKMATPQTDGANTACLGTHPDGELIAGWALGGGDWFLPSHVGMDLGQGDFILEVHYNNSGAPATDASGVHVCEAKTPRPDTASISWLGADSFPVGAGILIPAGATPQSYAAGSTCTPKNFTQPIHILRSWPHMHKTGAHMRSTILRGGTTPELLLDHDFSFNNQQQYDTPAILNPGDSIKTECMYDNQTGAAIAFGESTSQEMCYDFIVSYPARSLIMDGDPLHSTACIPP